MYCTSLLLLLSCTETRPKGDDVEKLLEVMNDLSRSTPRGNSSDLYKLLSSRFKEGFKEEIQMARDLDSIALSAYPLSRQLRVLSLKNAMASRLKSSASDEQLFIEWFDRAGRNFPLENSSVFYYSTKKSVEDDLIEKGLTVPCLLIEIENNGLRVDLFNTPEFQQKRLDNILSKQPLEKIMADAAWLRVQTNRRISWDPL